MGVGMLASLESHGLLPERQPLFGRLAGAGSGTFWHVTDWHLNEFQPPGANADDMCRTAAASPSTEQPGIFGHPECDPTPSIWRAALAEMISLQPAPDFIYAGGDWFGHVAKEHDTERAVRSSALMVAELLEKSFPGAPVIHTIGNHDTWPYYSQASTWRTMERDWAQALGDAYIARNFPGPALASWRHGGYFARRLTPSLHAVVLNTNQLALGGGAEQLAWLEAEMAAARRRGGKVLLMGHIPPGPSHCELDSICLPGHYYQRAGGACWQHDAQARLLELLREYADVVPASLFGHHHTESLRIVRDPQGVARHVMYLSPALTPRNPRHDPAVRLYRYDRATGEISNFTDVSFDVRRANRQGAIRWHRASPLARAPPLNLTDLSPPSWAAAMEAVLASDSKPRSRRELAADDPFLQLMSPKRCAQEVYIDSGSPAVPPLRRCKLAVLCAVLHLEDEQYARCIGSGGEEGRDVESG